MKKVDYAAMTKKELLGLATECVRAGLQKESVRKVYDKVDHQLYVRFGIDFYDDFILPRGTSEADEDD